MILDNVSKELREHLLKKQNEVFNKVVEVARPPNIYETGYNAGMYDAFTHVLLLIEDD